MSSPQNLNNKFIINEAIKNRDFWMPFALTIQSDKQHNYIYNKKKIDCKYMTIGFDTKKKL